jgi:hypothetical protein
MGIKHSSAMQRAMFSSKLKLPDHSMMMILIFAAQLDPSLVMFV